MKKISKKHTITFAASPRELSMIQHIMKVHKRKTYSDAIRYLVETEEEKILPKNAGIEIMVANN